MTKTTLLSSSFTLIAVLTALALISSMPVLAQGRFGTPPAPGTVVAAQPLTAAESQALIYMREEEKLARDVYRQLYQKWNLTAFENIAGSEQRHFDAIGTLLERYAVADPAVGMEPGVFANPTLAALYAQLMAKGAVSVKDAIEVGVTIEKTDIEDLENALKNTARLDIKRVFTNLLNGSYNHLEAFEANLEILCPVTPSN
jgi:hypothetical protein